MSRKSSNIIFKVISAVLLLALLGAGIVFIYRYTNGLNEEFKTFYLEYYGEKILQSETEMSFASGAEATFDVKYTFDFGEEAREYSVKVLPNEDESFEYTVGDLYFEWRAEDETEDLSELFGLKKEASSFTLYTPAWSRIDGILGQFYPGEEISVEDPDALSLKPLYRLEVSSYDGKVTYVINFSVINGSISVGLNHENIVFGGA